MRAHKINHVKRNDHWSKEIACRETASYVSDRGLIHRIHKNCKNYTLRISSSNQGTAKELDGHPGKKKSKYSKNVPPS